MPYPLFTREDIMHALNLAPIEAARREGYLAGAETMRAKCVERCMNHAYMSHELEKLPLPEMGSEAEKVRNDR